MKCPECGELRTTINLKTGRRCWRCLSAEMYEPNECEPPPAVMEGISCMRMVENRQEFALFFAQANSNHEAMIFASFSWGMVDMVARPVWSLQEDR
jgi:hypothetical protein